MFDVEKKLLRGDRRISKSVMQKTIYFVSLQNERCGIRDLRQNPGDYRGKFLPEKFSHGNQPQRR